MKAGQAWGDEGLVFTSYAPRGKGRSVGVGLHPRNVLRTLYALLVTAKLPRCRFHDLRHSAASLLIASGVELVEVSMLLGHSELRVCPNHEVRFCSCFGSWAVFFGDRCGP